MCGKFCYHILIAAIFLFIQAVKSDWISPFFITERDDVVISLIDEDYVAISMNEEIISPFSLCYLNKYNGSDSPKIDTLNPSQLVDLGLKLEKIDDRWNMIITKTQDYENPRNRRYSFEMIVDNFPVTVEINVINIFDNPPTVTYENPCIVPELTESSFISECLYEVTDVDGMANNSIRFEIQGNFGESEIFGFKLDESFKDDYIQIYHLFLKKTLYYDQRFFYSFRVTVFDAGENAFSFNIIIEVKDMPNKPPMWIRVFALAQFPEKEVQEFEAEAIDGDTGINADICYNLEFEEDKDFSNLISMDRKSGKIYVQEIDRDTLKMEVFPFYIRAYECEDEESWIKNTAVLLVIDINDHKPVISFSEAKEVIEIDEETFYTLFQLDELQIEDVDLGTHATYNVKLEPQKFASALNIIPESGYQLQGFTISTLNPAMLDFEEPEFQVFNVSIIATETYFEDHFHEKTFEIKLINWNDELPKFEHEEYEFDVLETVGENFEIGTVLASDRDIDDKIKYFLSGRINERINVDELTGKLSTVLDRTFDYEQQSEMTFQVFAKDTLQTKGEPTHTTSTQVHINVIDVNDTPPTIILPRTFLTITENEFEALITNEIKVFDPDKSANLTLFIEWSQSTATGLDVKPEDYQECIDMFTDGISRNELKGTLKSSSTKIIDYEKFQVLFLTITAVDWNTEVNDNSTSAVLTVFVIDVNDNAPEFVGDTLIVKRSVIEESDANIFIGFIHAIDRDGPGNNDITFSLVPHDDETKEWIKIDPKTGELSVYKNKSIDCDVPVRFGIDYEVNISDGELSSTGNISITINDINNKVPQLHSMESEIKIYENASDIFLTSIEAFDQDRDEPHNIVQYSINYQSNPELQKYFSINLNTGELRVKELDEFNKLDRDTEPSEYTISIFIEDNLGIGARNGFYETIHIILLDVNDNAPQMPSSLEFKTFPIYEDLKESTTIVDQFYAPDIDEGLNGEVLYEVMSIEPIEIDKEWSPSDYEELFILENYENKYTRIKAGIDLKGFSGLWSIKILAVDRGNETEDGFSQHSEALYQIKIDPINYNRPVITYPAKNRTVLRLDFGAADIGRPLVLLNGSRLSPFEAFDDDAGIFGDVNFAIDSDPANVFEFLRADRKTSDLRLKSAVEEKVYEISIHAFDGGNTPISISERMNVFLAFIDKTSEPYFEDNAWSTIFTENVTGLEELRVLPEAIDPKNFGIESEELEFDIFYYIDDTYRPEDSQYFQLDSTTRVLSLKQMLDRESVDRHSIRIFASNQDTMPQIRFVSDNAMLYLEIGVEDVNDNPPTFVYEEYFVGISERDNLGKILLTLEATDPDLDDVITYYVLKDTLIASNTELDSLKDSAFQVNQVSGALTLNFEVKASMSGYFEFQVEARDLVNHTDTANVRIYIVAEANRVTFTFLNTVEEVRNADQSALVKIFSDAYEAQCVIDDILPYSEVNTGIVDDSQTNLRVHFIKNNAALDSKDIEQRSSDIVFITELSSKLSLVLSLKLKGLPTSLGGDDENKINNIVEIALASISGVLFVLLITVTVFYVIQRKNFSRQFKALSETKSDSDTPKFQNVKALPNTNIYSGQNNQFNPVMIQNFDGAKDIDTKSIISSDSDDFADLSKSHIFDISSKVNKDSDNSYA